MITAFRLIKKFSDLASYNADLAGQTRKEAAFSLKNYSYVTVYFAILDATEDMYKIPPTQGGGFNGH